RIGLLGGSFNPAHKAHRAISLAAMTALDLDEVWWLVSPGNPLKEGAKDMAPFEARFASAQRQARNARIRVTDFEQREGTRYTVDLHASPAARPHVRNRHPRAPPQLASPTFTAHPERATSRNAPVLQETT